VTLRTRTCAIEAVGGELRLLADDALRADRVVSLPRLHGPRIDGIAQTRDGFIPVDEHCRVRGVSDVLAAGDVTSFPVKQGGIAAQQADAAAETIAAGFGAAPAATPFRPILRGMLLTGRDPQYLRHALAGGSGETSVATPEPLWWPPAKIVGRYLAPFLAELVGADTPEAPTAAGAMPLEVDIEPRLARAAATVVPEELLRAGAEDPDDAVGAVMSRDVLLVAPEG
jgi:sulfide:quinone oxidoreductase